MQRQPSTSILFFLGIVGLTLFSLGWAIDNGMTLPDAQSLIEQLPIMTSPQPNPQATTQIVVLPNSTPNQIVLANGDLPQPVTIPQSVTVPQPVTIPQPVTVGQPVILKEAQPAIQAPNTITVTATVQPVITVTATLQPIITVTATTKPVIIVTATYIPATATSAIATATSAAATVTAINHVISGHCSEWTVGECQPTSTPIIYPTVVPPPPTYEPTYTPLPPTPTITATPTPENNALGGIVTMLGSSQHANIQVVAIGQEAAEQVSGEALTDEFGIWSIKGLRSGRYKLIAYSPDGTHIPACLEIDLSGGHNFTIPQTTLSDGGLSGDNMDEDYGNLPAIIYFHYKVGLSIPEHFIPIMDVSRDGVLDDTDFNMMIANPKLMGCQSW